MKKTAKNILLFFFLFLGYLNKFVKKRDIILFFTNNSDFNDNNKALLKYLIRNQFYKKYKIIYSSKDNNKYSDFKEVKYISTYFAPFYFLFSKYCFYDTGTLKIKPSSCQNVISLWHGVPLKKIGIFANEQSSKLDRYNDFTKILVPSEELKKIYLDCFSCQENQILINGFPRNDYLFFKDIKIIEKLKINYKNKNIIWMPTFRKSLNGRYSDSSYFEQNWDLPIFESIEKLKELDKYLDDLDITITLKLHPYSILNNQIEKFNNFNNINIVSNNILNSKSILTYEFLALFDALITDYSSVFFDFLLTDKKIAFTVDDMDSYNNNRGFTVDNPKDFLVGEKIENITDFYKYIDNFLQTDNYKKDREILKEKIHKYQDSNSTKRLLDFIGLKI